jgi:diguanylate cyclase (GGDEF)-like protein
MGLLFIDLDNFRSIHKLRGHDVGDRILVELARRLTKLVRATDTVCRYGVDEFVLLLGEISHRDHASAVADKIRETVSVPIAVGGHIVALQLSIGVSIYPDNGMIADDLFKKAKTVL